MYPPLLAYITMGSERKYANGEEMGSLKVVAYATATNSVMAAVIEELDRRRCTELVEEITRLEKKTFPKQESLVRSIEQEVMRKNSGLIYAKAVSEGRGGGELVGYVMYSWTSSLCASITKLVVKESYRRQGHGEALMKAAIQKCRTRNVQRICLHVDPERIPAVLLYEKLGFQIEELIESYYSADRNAYRMYLEFDSKC